MGRIAEHFLLNRSALKQCCEQMALSLEEVKKKIPSIEKIESGEKRPTYIQLSKLADLYLVPRWVFLVDQLPEEYAYSKKPSFRKFADSPLFDNSKVRKLVARVENYRDLFLKLREDMGEPVPVFDAPILNRNSITDIATTALDIRKWLSISKDDVLDIADYRKKIEQKDVFIFFTSKYKNWSHIDKDFRGLSIVDEKMPIIIVNNSDSKKAQLFTLLHELGHVLCGDMVIDGEEAGTSDIEKWCDEFAGEFLMPKESSCWAGFSGTDLLSIKELAKRFHVSPYACLVRLKQLGKIDQETYVEKENQLKEEYGKQRKKLTEQAAGSPRNRSEEIREQFGNSFVCTVLTTWQNQEMTLYKMAKLFDLKQLQHVIDLSGIEFNQ